MKCDKATTSLQVHIRKSRQRVILLPHIFNNDLKSTHQNKVAIGTPRLFTCSGSILRRQPPPPVPSREGPYLVKVWENFGKLWVFHPRLILISLYNPNHRRTVQTRQKGSRKHAHRSVYVVLDTPSRRRAEAGLWLTCCLTRVIPRPSCRMLAQPRPSTLRLASATPSISSSARHPPLTPPPACEYGSCRHNSYHTT